MCYRNTFGIVWHSLNLKVFYLPEQISTDRIGIQVVLSLFFKASGSCCAHKLPAGITSQIWKHLLLFLRPLLPLVQQERPRNVMNYSSWILVVDGAMLYH